ncbi:MAG: phage holin family protein [Bacteroides sp.]|nr:phage holin family protein [Ruminococcus flavefaciens]MCM1554303.1 phage holin family protein [Bacteroides sp.]
MNCIFLLHQWAHNLPLLDKYIHFGGIFFLLILLVITAILLDLWDAIHTARKLQEPIRSHRFRKTGSKILEYLRMLFLGALVDAIGALTTLWQLPYISMLFALGLVCLEIKSLYEHAQRRKSRLADLRQMASDIIRATSQAEAEKIIRAILENTQPLKPNNHE